MNDIFISIQFNDAQKINTVVSSLENEYTIQTSLENNKEQQYDLIKLSKLFVGFYTENFTKDDICIGHLSYASKMEKRVFLLESEKDSLRTKKCIQELLK